MSDLGEYVPPAGKWTVAAVVMLGTFMAVMDVTVVNVALPHMMGTFSEDLSAITWVATSYSIAQIIMVTMSGWWSKLLGRKRLYVSSLCLFIIGSILAGTAHTFEQMILYRILQGIGGGALIPVSQAILRESFPARQQGTAMAIFGMGVVLAPAAGPILGGWLTDHYGWPWIFYINVPISIPAILLTIGLVEDPPYLQRGVQRTDWTGIALLTVFVTSMQIVLERGQQLDWFSSRAITIGAIVAIVSGIALTLWELHIREPVVNIRLLKNVPLAAGSIIGLAFGIALMGTTFILPQFTQTLLGYSALDSGLVLAPRAFALFLFMPIAGILFRYIDGRLLIFLGIALMFWSYADLSHLSLTVDYAGMVPPLVILGAGMSFMFVTLTTVSLATIPREEMTNATSIYTLTRLIGGNIGYALVATLVAGYTQAGRSHLIPNITDLNPTYAAEHAQAAAAFVTRGISPPDAVRTADAAINGLVNQHATMIAYNQTTWILGLTLIALIPFVLLLPGRLPHHRIAPPPAE